MWDRPVGERGSVSTMLRKHERHHEELGAPFAPSVSKDDDDVCCAAALDHPPMMRLKLARTFVCVSARWGSSVAKSGRSAARARRRRSSPPAVFGSNGPERHRRSTWVRL